MYVDAVTICALIDELGKQLSGGRVQSVVEMGNYTFGFEIYAEHQRQYLVLSADPHLARCHLATEKPRRGVERPGLLGLLLKKYVDGAFIEGLNQPPWERIIQIDFSHPAGDTTLIIELMAQRSNIILLSGNVILESLRRIPPGENSQRMILPNELYVPPPPQQKAFPENLTRSLLEEFMERDPSMPAWKALIAGVSGISPLASNEIIFRASGRSDTLASALDIGAAYAAFQAFLSDIEGSQWAPCVVEKPGGYRAFAPYLLTHLGKPTEVDSISQAISLYFEVSTGLDTYEAARALVEKQIIKAYDKIKRKLASLERQNASQTSLESLRMQGELIFTYASMIVPKQTELLAEYDSNEPPLRIPLDPDLSPVQNAQRYFEKYHKAKRAARDIPALMAAAEQELAYLEQVRTDLALAENWPDIDAVKLSLQQAGYWQGERTKVPTGGQSKIKRVVTENGFVILIGRNSKQNHQLVTEEAAGDDLWLHVRHLPGGHVIIKHDGRDIPEDVIRYAAGLAAYYSNARNEKQVEVDVTLRKYVRPIKHGKPGMVSYKNERTINVQPILSA